MQSYPPVATMSAAERSQVVRHIFATSHARYDFLNHFLSFRRDVAWRRAAVERMRFPRTKRLLDVACGTADLAIAAAKCHPGIDVVGIDFSPPMLEIGRRKVGRRGLEARIRIEPGDALSLPFPDSAFDVTAVAFGMRNIPDKPAALAEMARVTVDDGLVMVLEMTFAPLPAFRALYGFYLTRILPLLAALFARNTAAYTYLADSIRHFPSPESFARLMREAGLGGVVYRRLSFGTAYLHVGRKPSSSSRGT